MLYRWLRYAVDSKEAAFTCQGMFDDLFDEFEDEQSLLPAMHLSQA